MALGDQNKKQNYENSYFSRTKFSNYEDKKTLSFSFWKGNLKVSINEIKESYSGIEYEELAYIHLSPNKAQILKSQLIDFINLEDSATTSLFVGVDTGISDTKNFIAIGNTTDSSEKDIQRVLCIGKVSPDGKVLEKTDFKFVLGILIYIGPGVLAAYSITCLTSSQSPGIITFISGQYSKSI